MKAMNARGVMHLALRQLPLALQPARAWPLPPPPGASSSMLPEAGACLFALLIQVTVWASTASNLALRGHLHQALICSGFLLSLRIATHPLYTQSRFWQRNRPVVITVIRLALGAIPANRSSTEGLASLLRRDGRTGLRGAFQDYFRFITGTHVFLIAVGPPLLALPPLAALVLNAGLMALTHNPGYCDTQLLSHLLSRQRLRVAAGAVDIALQASPSAVGAVVSKSVHAMDDRQCCLAFFTLQQAVLGVLVPTLAACWVPRPRLPPGPAATAAAGPEQQQSEQQSEQQQQQHQHQQRKSFWGRALGGASRAYESVAQACERADSLLTKCCRAVCTPTWRHAVGVWMVCCEFWLLSKIVATHSA